MKKYSVLAILSVVTVTAIGCGDNPSVMRGKPGGEGNSSAGAIQSAPASDAGAQQAATDDANANKTQPQQSPEQPNDAQSNAFQDNTGKASNSDAAKDNSGDSGKSSSDNAGNKDGRDNKNGDGSGKDKDSGKNYGDGGSKDKNGNNGDGAGSNVGDSKDGRDGKGNNAGNKEDRNSNTSDRNNKESNRSYGDNGNKDRNGNSGDDGAGNSVGDNKDNRDGKGNNADNKDGGRNYGDNGNKDSRDGNKDRNGNSGDDGAGSNVGDNKDGRDGKGNNADNKDGDRNYGDNGNKDRNGNNGSGTGSNFGDNGSSGNGVVGRDGKDGKDGKDGETKVVEVPAIQQAPEVYVLRGEKGDPGLTACSRSEVFPMPAMTGVQMSEEERLSFVLPLLDKPTPEMLAKIKKVNKRKSGYTKVATSIPRLPIGENSPGKDHVQDAQVLFKIPVTLPPRKYIVGASNVTLFIKTVKKTGDLHDDTEFLALLSHNADELIMSGRRYDMKTEWYWAEGFNNPAFPNAVNEWYSNNLVSSVRRQSAGKRSKKAFEITVAVDLNEILVGSKYKNAIDYLYRDVTDLSKPANVYLYFAVGDDTKVDSAQVQATFMKDTCAEAEDNNKRSSTPAQSSAATAAQPAATAPVSSTSVITPESTLIPVVAPTAKSPVVIIKSSKE